MAQDFNNISSGQNPKSEMDQIKFAIKSSILEQKIEPGLAIDVMRELFDDIAPADRTEFSKRISIGTTPTFEEFKTTMVYGGDDNSKPCAALYNALLQLAEGKETQQDIRTIFSEFNEGLEEVMIEFRYYPNRFFDGFNGEENPESTPPNCTL